MTDAYRHPASLRVIAQDDAQSAVSAMWREHRRWVSAIVLAHKPREVELEDLVQEVAVRLVAHAHELRDPTAIRPWLRSVALNVARSAGRKQRVRRDAKETIRQNAPRPTEDAPPSERDEILDAALSLPETYREPLILRTMRGMSYKQISDTLGIPVTTIETRLVRARRMLRDALDAKANPDATSRTDSDRSEHL